MRGLREESGETRELTKTKGISCEEESRMTEVFLFCEETHGHIICKNRQKREEVSLGRKIVSSVVEAKYLVHRR